MESGDRRAELTLGALTPASGVREVEEQPWERGRDRKAASPGSCRTRKTTRKKRRSRRSQSRGEKPIDRSWGPAAPCTRPADLTGS
jgi:hypothetical protein